MQYTLTTGFISYVTFYYISKKITHFDNNFSVLFRNGGAPTDDSKQNGGGEVSDPPAACLTLCFYNDVFFMLIGVLGVRLLVAVFVRELLPPACAMSLLLCSLHQPLRGTTYLVLGTYLVFASHHESIFISHAEAGAACHLPPPARF